MFSSLQVTHLAGMGFEFIMIEPLLPSCCGFFFVFECGIAFFFFSFGGFQHLPVDGYATAGNNFGALAGGDECISFYSAILNWKLHL